MLFKYFSERDTFQKRFALISDKNINPNLLRYSMDGSQSPHSWNTAFVLLTLTMLLLGCIRKMGETLSSPCETPRGQVSNMTRYLTARVNPNSSICLIVVNETSSRAAMYVITHCPFLVEESVNDEDFKFYRLSPGDYVAMVPREAFHKGFPSTGGYNLFNSSLKVNICGGDVNHSSVSFSTLQDSAKTEK